MSLIQQGVAIGVATAQGIATVVAIDAAGNMTTNTGQVLPPQPVILPPPPAESGISMEMIALFALVLVVGAVALRGAK
jgi:hypothetical protein